jgi:hypothetical protein
MAGVAGPREVQPANQNELDRRQPLRDLEQIEVRPQVAVPHRRRNLRDGNRIRLSNIAPNVLDIAANVRDRVDLDADPGFIASQPLTTRRISCQRWLRSDLPDNR